MTDPINPISSPPAAASKPDVAGVPTKEERQIMQNHADVLDGSYVSGAAHDIRRLLAALSQVEAELADVTRDRDSYKREYEEMRRSAHGLYETIVKRMEPHYPPGDRGLEWDVLPSTIGRALKELAAEKTKREEVEKELDKLNKRIATYIKATAIDEDDEAGDEGD